MKWKSGRSTGSDRLLRLRRSWSPAGVLTSGAFHECSTRHTPLPSRMVTGPLLLSAGAAAHMVASAAQANVPANRDPSENMNEMVLGMMHLHATKIVGARSAVTQLGSRPTPIASSVSIHRASWWHSEGNPTQLVRWIVRLAATGAARGLRGHVFPGKGLWRRSSIHWVLARGRQSCFATTCDPKAGCTPNCFDAAEVDDAWTWLQEGVQPTRGQ